MSAGVSWISSASKARTVAATWEAGCGVRVAVTTSAGRTVGVEAEAAAWVKGRRRGARRAERIYCRRGALTL
jgi:hypothetical protein